MKLILGIARAASVIVLIFGSLVTNAAVAQELLVDTSFNRQPS